MCGLVGFVRGTGTIVKGGEFARRMAYLDLFRGPHSTGLMTVKRNEPAYSLVYKKAMPAYDFLELQEVRKRTDSGYDLSVCAFHNRWATLGKVINENAHPFTHGRITLMHNGSIRQNHFGDYWDAIPNEIEVDSEKFTWLLEKEGEGILPEVLTQISQAGGAYVFMWHDAEDKSLNIVKNSKRSFKFLEVKGEDNIMVWASEPWMAHGAAVHSGVELDKVLKCTDGMHYKFFLPDGYNKPYRLEKNDLKIKEEAPKQIAVIQNKPQQHTKTKNEENLEAMGFKYRETLSIFPFDVAPIGKKSDMIKVYGCVELDEDQKKKNNYVEFVSFGVKEEFYNLIEKHVNGNDTELVGKAISVTSAPAPYDTKEEVRRVVIDQFSLKLYVHEDNEPDKLTVYEYDFSKNEIVSTQVGLNKNNEVEVITPKMKEELKFFRGPKGEKVSIEEWEEDAKNGCYECGCPITINNCFYVYEPVAPNNRGIVCFDCISSPMYVEE